MERRAEGYRGTRQLKPFMEVPVKPRLEGSRTWAESGRSFKQISDRKVLPNKGEKSEHALGEGQAWPGKKPIEEDRNEKKS
jgi:hypothetical protein